MAHNYILRVTTGTDYDLKTHKIVPVNEEAPVTVESELCKVEVNVRIQNYRGLPHTSPSTSPYFDIPRHKKAKDGYSIAFRLTPKEGISGDDLVWGNDFDHSIKDRLPPGFSYAFKLVKYLIDPGLDGDVYADQPYLYGPALSSLNTLFVHPKSKRITDNGSEEEGDDVAVGSGGLGENGEGLVFEEGGEDDGLHLRREANVPDAEAARKKFFLTPERRKGWEWEAGRGYGCDFFNPYLDFGDFALKLPGFTLPIMKYWDGQGLRYTLKNRATDKVLMVVLFTLYLKEDVDAEGRVKEGIEGGMPFDLMPTEQAERYQTAANGDATHEVEQDHEEAEAELEERMRQMKVAGKENKTAPEGWDDDGVD